MNPNPSSRNREIADATEQLHQRHVMAGRKIVEYCRVLVEVLEDSGHKSTALRLGALYGELDQIESDMRALFEKYGIGSVFENLIRPSL